MAFLSIPSAAEKTEFNLLEIETAVGSANDCPIRLVHRSISRRHALIKFEAGRHLLADCESTNGTTINGTRVQPGDWRALQHGDVIVFGNVSAMFLTDKDAAVQPGGPTFMEKPQELLRGPEGERLRIFQQIEELIRPDKPLAAAMNSFIDLLQGQLPAGRVTVRLVTRKDEFSETMYPEDGPWSAKLARRAVAEAKPIIEKDALDECNHPALSALCVPILVGDQVRGVVLAVCPHRGQAYTAAHAAAVSVLANLVGSILVYAAWARHETRTKKLMIFSPAMQRVEHLIKQYAAEEFPVLITGETGTGKELVARALHETSRAHRTGPFVVFDCAAKTFELFASELFGHVKGAFTGAIGNRAGALQQALDGAIFFDEIYNIPLDLQGHLLRVLQEREYQPLGSDKPQKIKARFIFATNRNLAEEVAAGRFREDLFYRVNWLNISIPPLRDRGNEVLHWARHFFKVYNEDAVPPRPLQGIAEAALRVLEHYHWPGNIRELESVIGAAFIRAKNSKRDEIELEDLSFLRLPAQTGVQIQGLVEAVAGLNLKEAVACLERELIRRAVNSTMKGKKPNYDGAAEKLGLDPRTLKSKMDEYEIEIGAK